MRLICSNTAPDTTARINRLMSNSSSVKPAEKRFVAFGKQDILGERFISEIAPCLVQSVRQSPNAVPDNRADADCHKLRGASGSGIDPPANVVRHPVARG